jgi:hypothetical protein
MYFTNEKEIRNGTIYYKAFFDGTFNNGFEK